MYSCWCPDAHGSYHPTLAQSIIQRGHKGPIVKEIQQHLGEYFRTTKWPALKADGIFGHKTEQAVRSFQADHGLPITGKVDQRTLEAIREALAPHHEEIFELIKKGDRGDLVKFIQAKLGLYFMGPGDVHPAIRPDGEFGPLTEKAVKSFQAEMGLPITGHVDDVTFANLGAILFPRHVRVPELETEAYWY